MRLEVFDRGAEALGAMSDQAKADLVGVDRSTIWRWRVGHQTPNLDTILSIAMKLDLLVDDLVERVEA